MQTQLTQGWSAGWLPACPIHLPVPNIPSHSGVSRRQTPGSGYGGRRRLCSSRLSRFSTITMVHPIRKHPILSTVDSLAFSQISQWLLCYSTKVQYNIVASHCHLICSSRLTVAGSLHTYSLAPFWGEERWREKIQPTYYAITVHFFLQFNSVRPFPPFSLWRGVTSAGIQMVQHAQLDLALGSMFSFM